MNASFYEPFENVHNENKSDLKWTGKKTLMKAFQILKNRLVSFENLFVKSVFNHCRNYC